MDQNQPLFALIQQLQQQLVDQQRQLETLAPTRSHFRLPDPPRFDGRPFSLKTWLPAVQAKLRSDGLAGQQAFDYVYDRLEPPQQASVLHLRETNPTPEAVFQYFERLCHNPREKQDAVLRFANIRQKDDESLVAYLARFERLSHEAKVHQQDLLRTITLHRGLRPALRQILEQSYDTLFDLEYDDYIELLQRHDRRQQRPVTQRQNQTSQNQTSQNQTSQNQTRQTQTRQSQLDLMDLDPVRINGAQSSPVRVKSNRVRLSKPPLPLGFNNPANIAERAKHGLCYYCGACSHWISACPFRLAANKRSKSLSLDSATDQSRNDPDSSPFWNSDGYDSDHPSDLGGG
jgi:hypothetical protein